MFMLVFCLHILNAIQILCKRELRCCNCLCGENCSFIWFLEPPHHHYVFQGEVHSEQKEDPEDEEGDDAGGEDTVEVCPVHGLPLVLSVGSIVYIVSKFMHDLALTGTLYYTVHSANHTNIGHLMVAVAIDVVLRLTDSLLCLAAVQIL